MKGFEQAYDLYAIKTIATKSIGCLLCNPHLSYPLSGIDGENYYSYITSPGYQGIPNYEDFLSKEIYLNTKCSSKENELKMYNN